MAKSIDFNKELKNLDGKAIVQNNEPVKIKVIVSNTLCLVRPKKSDDISRQFHLAMKIFASEESLLLDDIDVRIIHDALTASDLTPIVCGQILSILEN